MNFNDNKPIYLQMADRIMEEMASGTLLPGARLPSVRDYAVLLQVNANTVMRTYTWLQDHGLIYNKRGIGFFVSQDAKERAGQTLRTNFMLQEAEYFWQRLSSFGVTPAQLADMYSNYLNHSNDGN